MGITGLGDAMVIPVDHKLVDGKALAWANCQTPDNTLNPMKTP
jgi:hypothetical protein